jgi:hypothetical protein
MCELRIAAKGLGLLYYLETVRAKHPVMNMRL